MKTTSKLRTSTEIIEIDQIKEKINSILKQVEKGSIIRVVREGKGIMEIRPVTEDTEKEFLDRLKDKDFVEGGTGSIGKVKSIKNLKPEMPVSGLVIEDRR